MNHKTDTDRGRKALEAYLKDCDDHAIVPDVGGAFHFAFMAGRASLATSAGSDGVASLSAAEPEGMVTVPEVPTNAMTSAGANAVEDPENERSSWDLAENVWRAMVEAAPALTQGAAIAAGAADLPEALRLSNEDAEMLEQAVTILEAHAVELKNAGADSASAAADCSAYVVRKMAVALIRHEDRLAALAAGQAVALAVDDKTAGHAMLWRQHCDKLDALVTYCPTCCQGFIAQKDISRDEVIFECGKTAGREAAKKLTAQAAQQAPAGATSPWSRALEIRIAQGWMLKGDRLPVLYTDTINDEGVGRDDLWLCTTSALAAPPAAPSTPASGGWMPIETAPKNGTEILGYTAEVGALVLYWDTVSQEQDRWSDGMSIHDWKPIRWQPLPASPTIEGESNV